MSSLTNCIGHQTMRYNLTKYTFNVHTYYITKKPLNNLYTNNFLIFKIISNLVNIISNYYLFL